MRKTDQPLRVLQVLTGMGSGGVEAFLMNMYRHMDRERVQFDFLLRSSENLYEDEIRQLGGKIYYTASFPRHFLKNKWQVRNILKEHHYSVIHVHANALLYTTALVEAKKFAVPCRIMHSHSISAKYRWSMPIHKLNQKRIDKLATMELACSSDAAIWMFGKPCKIIKNAIALDKFRYNENSRRELREEYHIADDAFVLGHVGRFLPVKNHEFILNVFKAIVQMRKDAYLVLVGTGELFEEVKERAEELELLDRILFLGVLKDVNRILSMLDAFIFPSLYEGLGISAVEAQANGLPIFCSTNIPDEAVISPNAYALQLSDGEQHWAEKILESSTERLDNMDLLKNSGYDIEQETRKLQNLYLLLSKDRGVQ